ncbi:MAG TPA: outer membrane lipoprotein chaperone LolA [candidate division Zixibacteria bacterium]|nr:outer membrane lipoprotein chaperone LolA [candidate division Zixibacteria bacterium]
MIRFSKFALLAAFLFAAAFTWAQQVDVKQIADAVDKRYNSLQSLRADFTESYEGGGMRRVESGTLWIRKPGQMRWEYSSPRPKLFVTDGHTAWFYVPGERQARRAQLKQLDDLRSPLRYLLGHTKLEKEFKGLSIAVDQKPSAMGDVVLRGVPVNMQDRISEVLLEVSGGNRLARIYIEELDGSRTVFSLANEQDNIPVNGDHFRFRPPAGVEVMQATELEP